MSFKKAVTALAVLVLTVFCPLLECFAESGDENAEKPGFSGDLSLVTRSYDEENMMYLYTFPDGAVFYSSEVLSGSGNSAAVFLVGSEEEDVSILVNGGEGFLDPQSEYLFSENGSYEVTVSHALRNGSGSVQARFAVDIGEQPETAGQTEITGRVQLESIDGESFRHTFINGSELVTNVLDGETVGFMPKLTIPEALICSATRDGQVFAVPSSGLITEDGAYNMEFTCYDGDRGMERRTFSFNLFTKPTNRLGIYQPPYGYEISGVKHDGETVPALSGNYTLLDCDGEYSLEYTNGDVTRMVRLTRDTTPPVLYFNGTTDIVFSEKITVTTDTECTIRVTKNGQVLGSSNELLGAGIYRVTATDTAGNITSARVEIKAVSAINPLDIIIIVIALAVAALVFFFIQKNRRITVR